MTDIILSTQNGEPVASSRQIAENFGKEHKNVIRLTHFRGTVCPAFQA